MPRRYISLAYAVPLRTIFNNPMLPIPFSSLTDTLSYQLLLPALPRIGIDIEQNTAVSVLAP